MDEQITTVVEEVIEPQFEEIATEIPKISISADVENIEIYGTDEMRIAMFTDWAGYMGEIKNPNTTATNPGFKKADGTYGVLYAPLDEVLNTTRPVLSKYGFGLFQAPISKTGQISVKSILTHKSGGFMAFPTFSIRISRDDAQGSLSGLTYARRGSANSICGMHGEVDDDGNSLNAEKAKKPTPSATKPDEIKSKIENVNKLAKELGGSKNPKIMEIMTSYAAGGNTNTMTDIKKVEELYTTLEKFREDMKKESK